MIAKRTICGIPLSAAGTALALAVYLGGFFLLDFFSWHGMAIIAIVPVVTVGAFYGMIPGICAALASFPVNMLLFIIAGTDWYELMIRGGSGMLGTAGLVFIGAVVGRIRELSSHLQRELAERGRTESALRNREEHFRVIAHSAPEAIVFVDAENRIVYWNPGAQKIFGYEEQEIIGKSASVLLSPGERSTEEKRYRELSLKGAGPSTKKTIEMPAVRKDGTEFPAEFSLSSGSDGGQVFYCGILRDITGRKQSENELKGAVESLKEREQELQVTNKKLRDQEQQLRAANQQLAASNQQLIASERDLRASEEFLDNIFKTTADGILVTDSQGTILKVNAAMEKMLGFAEAELAGRHTVELGPGGGRTLQVRKSMFEQLFESGFVTNWETSFYRKDGGLCPVEVNITLFYDQQGGLSGSVGAVRDITERGRMERQLRQSQKMEAIGTLAGGVAHDFNNILAAVIGYTEMTLCESGDADQVRQNAGQVLKAAERARQLVKQILAFSRQTDQECRPVSTDRVVREALDLLRASIPTTISIRYEHENDVEIVADPTQLHQVLMNLCANAAHAMREHGGTLGIGLNSECIDADSADLEPGWYAVLSVSDTGCGIDPSILDRIFDPFFTTKGTGQGSGMGLAVVHGIVASYGGTIRVTETQGGGSTFRVYLPRFDGEAADTRDVLSLPSFSGNERILFVDDEEALVALASRQLSSLGYEVSACSSSRAALDEFCASPRKFDLVITDYTMPDMNGCELSRELLQMRPDIPIIMCTGFNDAVTDENIRQWGVKSLVLKPYRKEKIAAAIRNTLEGP